MDGLRSVRRLLGTVGLLVGAVLVAQAVLATFTTGTTVVSEPHETATLELVLDAGGTARLATPIAAMLPGDVRESLVVVTPGAGSADLGDLSYQVTGALVADESPAADDPTRTNVLAEPATRGLAIELRRCDDASTFRVRTVDVPVTGATDVYCDRDGSGTPGAFDAGDTDGTLVGAMVDPADGAAAPTVPLALWNTPVGAGGASFNVRVLFVDDGVQNDLQSERFTLVHAFTAGPARAAGNV